MLIALIADIHGNLPALEAAVKDTKKRGATTIICAGDIVGFGPFPNQVCDYLKKNNIPTISGNYDNKVLQTTTLGKAALAGMQKKKKELVLWTARQLSKNNQRFLAELPAKIEQTVDGHSLLVVHGSPLAEDDNIYPSITPAGLKRKLGDIKTNILVCGHTHIPFVKRLGGTMVINCGSVGHPVDGDPCPSYVLLSITTTSLHANIIRFSYNISETIAGLKKSTLPKALQKDFTEGTKRRFLL